MKLDAHFGRRKRKLHAPMKFGVPLSVAGPSFCWAPLSVCTMLEATSLNARAFLDSCVRASMRHRQGAEVMKNPPYTASLRLCPHFSIIWDRTVLWWWFLFPPTHPGPWGSRRYLCCSQHTALWLTRFARVDETALRLLVSYSFRRTRVRARLHVCMQQLRV